MPSKKGQITTFIILGIIIVSIIAFYVYFSSKSQIGTRAESLDVQPVSSFVEMCIKTVGEEGIYFISSSSLL